MAGMKRLLILQLFSALVVAMAHATTNFDLAAKATNELAVDLHRQLATGNENLCVSPYSIENALAMTFAGADRKSTRLNSSHVRISYAVFCLKKKKTQKRLGARKKTKKRNNI